MKAVRMLLLGALALGMAALQEAVNAYGRWAERR